MFQITREFDSAIQTRKFSAETWHSFWDECSRLKEPRKSVMNHAFQ